MKKYYEYDESLWIRESGKGGRIVCFCLGGKHKGATWRMSKEDFSRFKRLKLSRTKDYEKIQKYLKIEVSEVSPLTIIGDKVIKCESWK